MICCHKEKIKNVIISDIFVKKILLRFLVAHLFHLDTSSQLGVAVCGRSFRARLLFNRGDNF